MVYWGCRVTDRGQEGVDSRRSDCHRHPGEAIRQSMRRRIVSVRALSVPEIDARRDMAARSGSVELVERERREVEGVDSPGAVLAIQQIARLQESFPATAGAGDAGVQDVVG